MPVKDETLVEMEEDTQNGKYLTFSLGKEDYGINIRYVTEIIGIQNITEIPEMPEYIKGIINLRGKIIPVMDVRLRFKKEFREYNERTCVIVVDINDVSIGLIIDSVAEVLNIPEPDIIPPPKVGKDYQHQFIKGVGKVGDSVKLILNCDKMINEDEVKTVSEIG